MRGREAAPLRRFRSPIGLLVDLVNQLHEDVRARLHRLVIGTLTSILLSPCSRRKCAPFDGGGGGDASGRPIPSAGPVGGGSWAKAMKVDAPDESEGAAGKRVKATIDRIDMQMDSRKLDFGINGMSIENGDNSIKVDEASLKGFDWSSSIKAISELAGPDDTEIETFPFNRLIPEVGTIRVGGINVDVAAPKKSDEEANEETKGTPERVKFRLKNFAMGLTKPFNGIPTDITIRQDDLTLPIPADSSEEVLVEARKLGIESLALSYGLSGGWDEPNNNLMIRKICFSGKDIGSVNFSGLANGFTEEFFSFDIGRAQAALFGLAGSEVKLTIKDEGLRAKAMKLYSLENHMSEAEVRATLTLVATALLQQVAAEQPKLQNAVEALGRFISTPGTLTVTVKSTGANGLGLPVYGTRGFASGCRLRPSLQGFLPGLGQAIDSPIEPFEPAIDIREQDFAGIWDARPDLAHAHGA